MTWIVKARDAVREATLDLPETATLQERRKRLRERGSLFHGGTYWGRKKWGQAVREYLARHGAPQPPQAAPVFAPDIVFPWKGESSS